MPSAIPVLKTGLGFEPSNSNFENADQVLKYVILRRPTSKLLLRTQQPADEESFFSGHGFVFFPLKNYLLRYYFFLRNITTPLSTNSREAFHFL
jgi:hypothetical protein